MEGGTGKKMRDEHQLRAMKVKERDFSGTKTKSWKETEKVQQCGYFAVVILCLCPCNWSSDALF